MRLHRGRINSKQSRNDKEVCDISTNGDEGGGEKREKMIRRKHKYETGPKGVGEERKGR